MLTNTLTVVLQCVTRITRTCVATVMVQTHAVFRAVKQGRVLTLIDICQKELSTLMKTAFVCRE